MLYYTFSLYVQFIVVYSKIVLYVFFILSCTRFQFGFLCSLFVPLYCSDTNTLLPPVAPTGLGETLISAALCPWRANYGTPDPATHLLPLIHLHCPVPIWSIQPIKPAPPSHFWQDVPRTMMPLQYFKSSSSCPNHLRSQWWHSWSSLPATANMLIFSFQAL